MVRILLFLAHHFLHFLVATAMWGCWMSQALILPESVASMLLPAAA